MKLRTVNYRVHVSVDEVVDWSTKRMRCDVAMACGCTGTIIWPSDLKAKLQEPAGMVQVECPVHEGHVDVLSWTWRELDS